VSIRFGLVSTYTPTLCGLATFTSALRGALAAAGDGGNVVRVLDQPEPATFETPEVVGEFVAGRPAGRQRAVELLNGEDVAIVQHEYGIYGGPDGDEVLPLLAALTVPSIVVLHTVLSDPTDHQREVLEAVVALAGAVVTMTQAARDRLAVGYAVDLGKVVVIPHGASTVRSSGPTRPPLPTVSAEAGAPAAPTVPTVPTVLTWGLLGPGKGIEWAVEAMALLTDLPRPPHYLIAGRTHPKVLQHQGESYRSGLRDRAERLGVADRVTLDGRYRDGPALADLVHSADLVLLPYDSTEQVTSGVLIEAVAALKPVVATRFPHAVELLADGGGILVPHRDPVAIAAAVRTLLTPPPDRDPIASSVTASMRARSAGSVAGLSWASVAERYRELAGGLIRARVSA
jgi:glycosyltransferase involved in cell wall biosynthesis